MIKEKNLPKVKNSKELFSEFPRTSEIEINGKIKSNPTHFKVTEIPKHRNKEYKSLKELKQNKKLKECIIFKIRKRNLTTDRAKRKLLGTKFLKASNLGYAGMKDKYAITEQYFSASTNTVKNKELENLPKTVNGIKIQTISTGKCLNLGDLLGNQFQITIKNAETNPNKIKKIIEQSQYPNYFGSQRFSTKRSMNHLVGKNLLKQNYKKAAKIYLGTYSKTTRKKEAKARKNFWKNENPEKALKEFPKDLWYEKRMLKSLTKNQPNKWKKSFKKIPKRILTTLLHSYQSYIFNKALAKRIEKNIGLNQVQTGDILLAIEQKNKYKVPERRKTILVTENLKEKAQTKVDKGEAKITGPIPGQKMRKPEGKMGKIEKEVTELKESDFKKRPYGIKLRGGRRELSITHQNLEYRKKDENLIINFFLPKGNYATVFLREFLGNDPLKY